MRRWKPTTRALGRARTLADGIVATAQAAFDAKSVKGQESDEGIQVRSWIEQWEVSLDDIDLELPEPLSEVANDEQAGRWKVLRPALRREQGFGTEHHGGGLPARGWRGPVA